MNDTATEFPRFVMKYPPGHELAGQDMERPAKCKGCERDFTQQRIDRSYLVSLNDRGRGHLDAFIRTCQLETVDGKKQVWFAKECPKCTRSRLNPDPKYAPLV